MGRQDLPRLRLSRVIRQLEVKRIERMSRSGHTNE